MKERFVGAFARVARCGVLVAVATGFGAGWLQAQGTGKIEGRVRDQDGAPIANAQVRVEGTALAALSNVTGYYFINNVPAGTVTLKASFIGYRPVDKVEVKVLAGQTMTEDFSLQQSPLEVAPIVVTAEQPLVPRDRVTSKQRVDGEFADRLPIDNIGQVLRLQPGVTADNQGKLSIRGGRNNEAATYIDGVPVTPGYRGDRFVGSAGTEIAIATNAFEEVSVTTGSSSAEFGNAKSGIISIETKAGGTKYAGSLSYETDEPFGVNHSVGLNRIQGGFSGPVTGGLTFSLNAELQGQKAVSDGFNSTAVPIFQLAGVDTTVAQPLDPGSPTSDTTYVDIYNYAITRGDCDTFSGSSNAGISGNYGLDCSGVRLPATARSSYAVSGKLQYTYGTGSRVALSTHASRFHGHSFPYPITYYNRLNAPQTLQGLLARSNIVTLNWTQNLSKSTERALALDAAVSFQQDRTINGPLTRESDLETRNPFGGFILKPMDFRWDFDNFPIDDQLISDFRSNSGRAFPYPSDYPQMVDLVRNNAYGLYGRFGGFVNTYNGVRWLFSESGGPADDNRMSLYKEDRLIGKGSLDWQVDRYNRLKAGGEFTRYRIDNYSASLTSKFFSDAYRESPIRWNGFLEDRLDLGDVVIVGGLRYDYYDSRASRPWVYDTLGNHYAFPRIWSYAGTVVNGGADTLGTPFDPSNPTANFVRDQSHDYLSPHVQVSFPVTDRTNFRLSYSHQVQTPDFALLLGSINTDLDYTNENQVFGSDLDFGKTITFEFGVSHAFNDDMVLDVAAYNKDILSDPAARLISVYDPAAKRNNSYRMLTNLDFGNVRGVDLRLDRRIGNYFNGNIAYSYQQAKNTGSDPFTYVNYGSRIVNQVGGTDGAQPPPQGILPTDNSRPHQFSGSFQVTFPDDFRRGTLLGSILRSFGTYATFRYASGTAYTKCGDPESAPEDQSVLTNPFENCNRLFPEGLNSQRLPGLKTLDARFTKGFRLRGLDLLAYVDVRNLLNFRNVLTVFASNGSVRNDAERAQNLTADLSDLADEASNNDGIGAVGPDGSIILPADCGGWVAGASGGGTSNVANCVYLKRAEERFGNGDGVYSITEQSRAINALYDVARGEQVLTGLPRRARLGIEINF